MKRLSINNLCDDIIINICWHAHKYLCSTSIVCTRWRNLLLHRMSEFRARITSMEIREIVYLPAIFYDNLSTQQKLSLPNLLFNGSDARLEMQRYMTYYKHKLSWDEILRALIPPVAHNPAAYFAYLFMYCIQYRCHIFTLADITFEQLQKFKPRRINDLMTDVWYYLNRNNPRVINIIGKEYEQMCVHGGAQK